MDAYLERSLKALGLPVIEPEPEVAKASVARAQVHALTAIIARMLTESEPLLKVDVSRDRKTIIVRERGGNGQFKITVEPL